MLLRQSDDFETAALFGGGLLDQDDVKFEQLFVLLCLELNQINLPCGIGFVQCTDVIRTVAELR